MTILKIRTLNDLENLDKLGKKVFGEIPADFKYKCSFSPKIDISEDEKNIFLEAELPGLKKEEIIIKIENNTLTIKGEKKFNTELKERSLNHSERIFGSFERVFTLTENINSGSTVAEYENGVLKITLEKMKQPEIKERQIQVR